MADLRASIRIDLVDGASANTKAIAASTERLRESQLRLARAAQVVAQNELRSAQAALEDARAKGDAAEGSDLLARAELRAAKASAQLAKAEIAAARAEGQHASAAGRTAETVGTAMPAAADSARKGLLGVSAANKTAAFAAASNFNAVGELAYSFGNLTPATRGLGLSMVMAGGNAFAFAGSMGLAGVALGATLGIIPGLIDLFRNLGDEAEDAGDKAAEAASKFNELVDARLEEMNAVERQRELERGERSVQETTAAIQVREELADDAADRGRQIAGLGRAAQGSKTDAILGFFENIGGAGAIASELGGLVLEGEGLGKGLGSGLAQAGGRAARQARSEAVVEEAREQGRADRLRTNALPVAMEREAQEERETAASEASERVSIARRRFGRRLEDLGLDARRRQRLEQAVGDERFVELPGSAVRGLPSGVQDQIRTEAARVADAAGLARRAELVADQARIRQLDEARATERSRGGDDLGRVTIDRAGGGGGGSQGRAELVEARRDDPTAETFRDAGERQQDAASTFERAADSMARSVAALERAQERRSIDTGPSPIGGGE